MKDLYYNIEYISVRVFEFTKYCIGRSLIYQETSDTFVQYFKTKYQPDLNRIIYILLNLISNFNYFFFEFFSIIYTSKPSLINQMLSIMEIQFN